MYMYFHKLSQYALNIYIPQPHTTSSDTYVPIHCYRTLAHTVTVHHDMSIFTNCHSMLWHSLCHRTLWHAYHHILPQYALTCKTQQITTECSGMYNFTNCHSMLWLSFPIQHTLPQYALTCTTQQIATECSGMYNIFYKLLQYALTCTTQQIATECSGMYNFTNCHRLL